MKPRWLPGIARRSLKALPFKTRFELFYEVGRSLGVTSYEAPGKCGLIAGPLFDRTVMRSYLERGEFQVDTLAAMGDFFRAARGGGTLYDVGANIGLVSIPMLLRFPELRVIAFEPDPENFRLLLANAARNGVSERLTAHQAAAYSHVATLRFSRDPYNAGDHHIAADGTLSVNAVPLDSIPIPDGPILVKIDTQGAEPAVFQGGAATLARADVIIAEFWPAGMRRMGIQPAAVTDLIAEHFAHARLPPNGPWVPVAEMISRLGGLAGGIHDFTDFLVAKERFGPS